MDPLQSPSRSA
uniref:Uncharacterized protein n=1 Tax=Arundo donax TaxID=35708 RepID=A0A0A8ZST1_ARUDO